MKTNSSTWAFLALYRKLLGALSFCLIAGGVLPFNASHAQTYSYLYLDRFNSNAFNLNLGYLNFSTPWTEISENNGVAAGNIRVAPVSSNGKLLLGTTTDDASWSNVQVQRTMDLRDVYFGNFSFDLAFDGGQGTGTVLVRYSVNGGITWINLASYTKNSTVAGTKTFNMATQTQMLGNVVILSFVSSGNNGSDPSGRAQIDNVLVDAFIGPPLPLKLSGFTAVQKNNDVLLSWSTISENYTSHFEIEISHDGLTFSKLSDYPAAGHSTVMLHYKWLHRNVFIESNQKQLFYRLKMTDANNNFSYSPVIQVNNVPGNNQKLKLITQPNGEKTISFILEDANMIEAPSSIFIYDQSGKLVFSLIQNINRNQVYTLNIPMLTSGIYVLKLQNEYKVITGKFIIR